MKKMSFLLAALFTASAANAAVLSTSQYHVTALDGSWASGSTGWNLFPAAPTVADADLLMSNGYTDDFGHTVINGIYSGYPSNFSSITFGTDGSDVMLDTFSFITSRNYASTTSITLEYALNGGAWTTAASTTTGALLSPLSACLSGTNNNCAGQTATLNFGGVLADQWRLSFTGSQVSMHEVMIGVESATTPTDVPEPASLALVGLGLLGAGLLRRKKAQ